jgi:hypothetical protein
MVPPQGRPTSGRLDFAEQATNSIDAITKGTMQGVELLLSFKPAQPADPDLCLVRIC